MPKNAAHLTAPLLMVSGKEDPTQKNADDIFAQAPSDPRNEHMTVEADHLGTPAASVADKDTQSEDKNCPHVPFIAEFECSRCEPYRRR